MAPRTNISPHSIPSTITEPYLDIMVPADAVVTRPPHADAATRRGPQESSLTKMEDAVYIPALQHTGVNTNLFQGAHGYIGKNVRKAVTTHYPASDQHQLASLTVTDMSKKVTTVTAKPYEATGSVQSRSQSLSQSRSVRSQKSSQTSGRMLPPSRLKNVVQVNTTNHKDPFVNKNGEVVNTKLHDLVYSKRMGMPHSQRKTRYTQEILKKMREDTAEFSARIPI